VILVALKEGHAPTAGYITTLREVLPAAFPENVFYFQAADMVTQILNFGIPAQINVRSRIKYRGASFQGKASVICRAIHSAVGCAVTLTQTSSRRSSCTMIKT
jgi:hypothetical protein